jgi:hypothetical protein
MSTVSGHRGKQLKCSHINFLYKIVAIIYKSYDDRGVDIPHFRALMTIILSLFLTVTNVALFFDIPSDYIMPWSSSESNGSQYLKATFFFLLPIIFIAVLFNRNKLDKIPVTENELSYGRVIVPIYLFLSIALLAILLVRHGINRGTI